MRLKSSVTKKITAAIIAMMVVFIVFLSAFCLGLDAGHDCSGEDCPICDFMRQCENTLRQIGGGCVVILAMALVSLVFCLQRPLFSVFLSKGTPVSLKVRMNM
jgi:hypothetical protein